MFRLNLNDLDRFTIRARRLTIFTNPDDPVLKRAMDDLLKSWERFMEEGNRKGVLAGTDGAGQPAPPLRYRPKGEVRKLTVEQRLGQRPRKRRGEFYGAGKHQSGLNNNLTTTEYRHLDGPRLAPRRQFSRSVTNTATTHDKDPDERLVWYAELSWVEVVSPSGFHFLPVSFKGLPFGKNGPRVQYDLRGIRPPDQVKMRTAFQKWTKLLIRGHFGE